MRKGIAAHRGFARLLAAAGTLAAGPAVLAAPAAAQTIGAPEPWQWGFPEAVTPVMEQIDSFHNLLLVITTAITVFVLGLMLYICYRYRESKNPTPSKTTHNTLLEVVWTTVPVIILVVIAIPSFRLIYFQDQVVNPNMTVKAVGHQWYWSYEYPDHGDIAFNSFLIDEADLEEGQLRQMEVDNRLIIPTDTRIRIEITATDVIHAFGVPSFGVKMHAIPGTLNETWVEVTEPGVYYGFCYELCGLGHAYMPIVVEAVSPEDFEGWVEQRQAEMHDDGGAPLAQATAESAQ